METVLDDSVAVLVEWFAVPVKNIQNKANLDWLRFNKFTWTLTGLLPYKELCFSIALALKNFFVEEFN